MLQFQDNYFQDEVRDGFFVPSMMKMAWSVELTVLAEIDRICKKYHITYWAEYGTMLGAVRHRGFIPWDDDCDIAMKREDYERFLQVAEEELPEGFAVFNLRKKKDYWYFVTRVVAKEHICFEPEYLRQAHNFPYIAGVDLFVFDYVAADKEQEEQRDKVVHYILAVADRIGEGTLKGKERHAALGQVEKICNAKLLRRGDDMELKKELYLLAEKLLTFFHVEEADTITQLVPWGIEHKRYGYPKDYYEKTVRVPFENIEIPIPVWYHTILSMEYGNYMTLVKSSGIHNYPFYATQMEQLQSVLDFEIPQFKYRGEASGREHTAEKSLKEYCLEYCAYLKGFVENTRSTWEKGYMDSVREHLAECQQVTIQIGNLIEEAKGEGYVTVGHLEDFCERLYAASMDLTLHEWERLSECVDQLYLSFESEIISRIEILFLPFKAECWNTMQDLWAKAVEDAECDVNVVVVPYYYKDYDGSRWGVLCEEIADFPEEIGAIPWDRYNLALHQPDKIVFQNPYDEWNPAYSVEPSFYAANLRRYTKQLVYVPYFAVEEFDRQNDREYYNMNAYCTVPGVVYADQVLVQSEQMKRLYIEKLMEFASGSERWMWENKIRVLERTSAVEVEKKMDEAPLPLKDQLESARRNGKKIILYCMSSCDLFEQGMKAIRKLKSVLSIFQENSEKICLLYVQDSFMLQFHEHIASDVMAEYQAILGHYKKQGWGCYIEGVDERTLTGYMDAYYGSAGILVKEAQTAGKPVMLQNIDLL